MVLQMKISPMEQIKKISMIKPEEWADTHLEAHEKINSAITQFYGLFTDLISQFKSLSNKQEDAEEKNSTSFSKLKEEVDWLKKDIRWLTKSIEERSIKLNKWREFQTKNYKSFSFCAYGNKIQCDTFFIIFQR